MSSNTYTGLPCDCGHPATSHRFRGDMDMCMAYCACTCYYPIDPHGSGGNGVIWSEVINAGASTEGADAPLR